MAYSWSGMATLCHGFFDISPYNRLDVMLVIVLCSNQIASFERHRLSATKNAYRVNTLPLSDVIKLRLLPFHPVMSSLFVPIPYYF